MEKMPFHIEVKIDGFPLRLPINREDEEVYRRAADNLNSKIAKIKSTYPSQPYQTIMMFVAYEIAVENGMNIQNKTTAPLADKVAELTEAITKTLSETEL